MYTNTTYIHTHESRHITLPHTSRNLVVHGVRRRSVHLNEHLCRLTCSGETRYRTQRCLEQEIHIDLSIERLDCPLDNIWCVRDSHRGLGNKPTSKHNRG